MTTVQQARAALVDDVEALCGIGDERDGWTVVSYEFSHYRHSDVYFVAVASAPDGSLWRYTVRENEDWGIEVEEENPVPVTVKVETKQVISYVPRLIPKQN